MGEHKKVAFDVYQAMGGGFWRRTKMMLLISPGFMAGVARIWFLFCQRRGLPLRASSQKFAYFLLVNPGLLTRFAPHWLSWFRPGFHPADTDRSEAPILRQRVAELEQKRSFAGDRSDGFLFLGPSGSEQPVARSRL